MKRIGVLGGMSPQATMDFEARVHRLCQTLVPQHWNAGYPPMLVWYHRGLPVRIDAGGRPILPMQVDPDLVEAAAWLGKGVDFLVIPCNAAHVGLAEIRSAAGCAVVSMVDATLDDVIRRGWRRVGVLGFRAAPSLYTEPLRQHGIICETIDGELQVGLDAAIQAVMEGRDGMADADAARVHSIDRSPHHDGHGHVSPSRHGVSKCRRQSVVECRHVTPRGGETPGPATQPCLMASRSRASAVHRASRAAASDALPWQVARAPCRRSVVGCRACRVEAPRAAAVA